MENASAKNIRKEEDVKETRRTNGLEKDARKLAKLEEFANENNSEKIWSCPCPWLISG